MPFWLADGVMKKRDRQEENAGYGIDIGERKAEGYGGKAG